jgi:exodeoxyribonuclease VII large subunit
LRLRLAMARQRLGEASAHIVSFDLRGRGQVLRRRIERERSALGAALDRVVMRKRRRFTAAQVRFAALDLRARVGRLHRALEQRSAELQVRLDRALVAKRRRWQAAALQLEERSPFQILERGYAIAYDAEGKVLRSPDQVALGDDISVRLARGDLAATVREKKKST